MHVLHHRSREAVRDGGQQRLVVAQAHGERPRSPGSVTTGASVPPLVGDIVEKSTLQKRLCHALVTREEARIIEPFYV